MLKTFTEAEVLVMDERITLDKFAVAALQGLLATGTNYTDKDFPEGGWDWYAKAAFAMAKAMIKERKNH